MNQTVLVCQNKTCSKQGSAQVLETFQQQAPADSEVKASGCLGQCGSGPTVLILPKQTWCLHVQPRAVASIVKQHLVREQPAEAGSKNRSIARAVWIWIFASAVVFGLIAGFSWFLAQQSYYF